MTEYSKSGDSASKRHCFLILLVVTFLNSCDWSTPPPPDPLTINLKHPQAPGVSGVSVGVNSLHLVSPKLIGMIRPTLPAQAKRAGINELVVLEVEIDEGGHVSVLRVVRGDPTLNDDAVRAAGQWRYEPAVLEGKPTRYITTIVIQFQEK